MVTEVAVKKLWIEKY